MRQQQFESLYQSQWEAFESYLDLYEKHSPKKIKQIESQPTDFPQLYRKMCYYLSIAKERKYSYVLVDQLNNLIIRGYHQLYKPRKTYLKSIIRFFVRDFPQLIRREWKCFALSCFCFYLSALLMFFLTSLFPELVYSVFDQHQINQFEAMYDPMVREIGRAREADTDIYMFGFYIANNIGISFQVFAGGILFGIGSIFYLLYNGIVFGTVAAHLVSIDFTATFFPFVIGHGAFELTAIVIAGGAGFKLSAAIISPGRLKRIDAIKNASAVSIRMVFGMTSMLIIAAFIEAFWSSSTMVAAYYKYVVGAGLWFFIIIYFAYSGRARDA